MKNMPSVIIIGAYYGDFPVWFPYWLKSCADNTTIDFLLITDIKYMNLPANVHILDMTLAQVKELAGDKLQLKNLSLEHPYKLCDYRPCYGVIFEDYISNYDYWGHCDFDLIWGDIRGFLLKYDIEKYDKFLSLGHLGLYRNTAACNHYYQMSGSECGDYAVVLTQEKTLAFDETDGICQIYRKNNLPMFDRRVFAEIKTFHKRFRLKKCDRNYKHQVFYYENGKIFRDYWKNGQIKQDEYIYIHFRRKLPADKNRSYQDIKNFYITAGGFQDKETAITGWREMEKYNPNPGIVVESWETVFFCLRYWRKLPEKLMNYLKRMDG